MRKASRRTRNGDSAIQASPSGGANCRGGGARIAGDGARRRVLAVGAGLALAIAMLAATGCETTQSGDSRMASSPAVMLDPLTEQISDTTVSFEMIPVPAGKVTIETENGPQEVAVGPFWISPTELTWDLYDVFQFRLDRRRSAEGSDADAVTRPSKPYLPPDRGYGHSGYPAISISYFAAESFCKWLTLKTGRTYRLPTEAEWIHVCRLGNVPSRALHEYAWYNGNTDYTTKPVAMKKPDANGLYDTYGNVAEWCTDLEGNPVTFGGSFRDPIDNQGWTVRVPPTERWNDSDPQIPKGTWWLADCGWVGFRIVCEP